MSRILLVVDMQNDFIDGALGTKEAVAIVPYVKEVIEKSNKYLKLFQNEYDIKVRFMRAKSLRYLSNILATFSFLSTI